MVVDADGQPRKGANVRLVYQNYSVEVDSHEVTLQTDETGRALFPAQHSSANLAQRCLSMISAAGAGVHASSGRHAFVFVFGNGYEGSAVDENNVVHGLAGLSRHNVVNDCREMTCHD